MTATARLVVDRTKSSSHPSPALLGQGDARCPVADLAREAADILRAMKAMGHSELRDPDTEDLDAKDFPLFRQFDAAPTGPSAEYVAKSLFKRLYAVKDAATFRRATSVKGALFQLYLSGNIAGYVSGALVDVGEDSKDMRTILKGEETCERLLQSAVAALQPMVGDDQDLAIIRRWFFDTGLDPLRITDLAMERAKADQA
uniref:Uncharacterized protein n=1 Tax=Caulobacter sp. (strain K31) TaxID=366602 RepID=B0T6I9_CAUSK